jgi:predicted metal-binding membrane protein
VTIESPPTQSRQLWNNKLFVLAVIGIAALAWAALAWMTSSGVDHHSVSSPTVADNPTGSAVSEGLPGSTATAALPSAGHDAAPAEIVPPSHHHGGASSESADSSPGSFGGVNLPALGLVMAAWALMVVAMMVPPALPMLDMVRRLVSRHRHSGGLLALSAVSFVGLWTLVGAALVINNAAVHALTEQWDWLTEHSQIVAGVVLVGAGIYQFTPLKNSCLRACRTPRGFALAYWHGSRPVGVEVMTMTAAYAASCIGCCWALMAVCTAVGVAVTLPTMIVLSVVMASERLTTWGPKLIRPVGVVLIGLGIAVAAGVAPGILG